MGKKLLQEIRDLEQRLATDYKTYKKEHPGTKKTPSDPMFQTGKPVTFPYLRNLEKSPNMGTRFGQHIEPHGEYLSHDELGDSHTRPLPNYEYGTMSFKNPLVVPLESPEHPMDHNKGSWGWKSQLHKQFGKKGKALSEHLKKLGYDGIVTHDKYGTSEIVNLAGEKKKR